MVLGGSCRAQAAGSVGLGQDDSEFLVDQKTKTVESEAVRYVVDRQLLVARWISRPSLEAYQVMRFDRVH